jgi:F-box protein 9
VELVINILKWVVSVDLDVRSLERCALVCRGLFLAARSSDLWRLICLNTWGLNNLPLSPPCWRAYFLSRPRVLLHGCYVASMTYVREGERGFQDNQSYPSWHLVKYYRLLRFYSGGRVTMLTSAEEPAEAVKIIGGKFVCVVGP